MTARRRRLVLLGTVALVVVALFGTLFPIYWTVATAFKTARDTFSIPPQLVPANPTLDNFAKVLANPEFMPTLITSVEITIATTVLCVVIGGLAAYAVSRFRFPGAELLQSAILVLRILPAITIIVPLYKIFGSLRLLDQLPVMVLVYTALNLPFAVWLLVSFFAQLPLDLEEAALVDGASRMQVLRLIVLPLSAPGIIATGLFVAILAWNEFLIPIVLATTNAKPLSVFVAGFIGSRTVEWGQLAAAASLAMLPIIVFSLIVQRYLVSGLTLGAVKE